MRPKQLPRGDSAPDIEVSCRNCSSQESGRSPRDGGRRDIVCPADGSHVATVDEAGPSDTEAAIAAARAAFDEGRWPRRAAAERGALLLRVADLLERDRDEIARAESLTPASGWWRASTTSTTSPPCFRYYGGLAGADAGRVVDTGSPDAISRVVHEPVGVCGLITPWNYPLLQASWKVAPALAAGNTFVLKPSELTPVDRILLMRAARRGRAARRRRQPRHRRRPGGRARRWPSTPTSTWSRSPAAWPPAGRSWPPPPTR